MKLPDLSGSANLARKTRRERIKNHCYNQELPCIPWKRLSSDLLEYRREQYLLLSGHYSKLRINRKLPSTSSLAIINHMKSIFAEHGIPSQLITDNGPHCTNAQSFVSLQSHMVQNIPQAPHYILSRADLQSAWCRLSSRIHYARVLRKGKTSAFEYCRTEQHHAVDHQLKIKLTTQNIKPYT